METKNILHCSTLVTTSFAPHLGDTFFPPLGVGGGEEDDSIPPSLGAVVGRRFRARGS